MITAFQEIVSSYHLQLPINLIAHTLIFLGSLRVAWSETKLPKWLVTCLWYIGLAACFNALSIVFQYLIGPQFPLSYWNINLMSETLLNITVAITAVALLCSTTKR